MADYIDRQALVENLATLATRYNALGRVKVAQDYNWAITVLEGEPAADVAPVVRCKDCKHFKDYGKTSLLVDEENIKAGWCYRRVRYDEEYRMPPDGFCSYGKIRNGG